MAVLISFIAVNNDRHCEDGDYGPNVNLVVSKFAKNSGITRVYFLLKDDDRQNGVFEYLKYNIETKSNGNIVVEKKYWNGDDPTDHKTIFSETKRILSEIYSAQRHTTKYVIHISPGTPTMHAIWLLLSETKSIHGKYQIVKSYRKSERKDPKVIDIQKEVFDSILFTTKGESDRIFWDVTKFKTEKLISVFKKAAMFAKINAPILILGERGTGKTTMAKWIRDSSPFIDSSLASWPTVVAGQYSDQLMRSELFGYKQSAFTGAESDKDGLLKTLDGDTLFLDEIADMSTEMQRMMIRAIEEKKYTPIGATTFESSDFRIITATNIPIEKLKEKLFLDFYDRISVFTLSIPPLRDIKEELSWLWEEVFYNTKQRAKVSNSIGLSAENHKSVVSFLQQKEITIKGNIRDLSLLSYNILAFLSSGLDEKSAIGLALEQYMQSEIASGEDENSELSNAISSKGSRLNEMIKGGINGKEYIAAIKNKLAEESLLISEGNRKRAANLLGLKDGKSIEQWLS